jgi:phenylalanyl-tRNA synthetase beta chain
MKISLRWIFDHIKGDINKIVVADLVDRFIKTTAEIDSYKEVCLDIEKLFLVQVISGVDEAVMVACPELDQLFSLPFRSDAQVGQWYIIECHNNHFVWAKSTSLGGIKDALLPAVHVDATLVTGDWKKTLELHDYILDIDNKSINHRPDLWGHRGIAREIAALLDLPMVDLADVTLHNAVAINNDTLAKKACAGDFSVFIDVSQACDRFYGLHLTDVQTQPSNLAMMVRLSRLDSRCIDYFVDCTNYVMHDLGQPMHAFDANLLKNKDISVRRARNKEKIALLDGELLELCHEDIVIADGENAVSLAGVMGGSATGINSATRSIFLESAHFDPTLIRRTSARYKKRTEASVRFEKNIDPNNAVNAITRFLFLLQKAAVTYSINGDLAQLGMSFTPASITVHHDLIEKKLGIKVSSERVSDIMRKLSFTVDTHVQNNNTAYIVTPPSFRATKDVAIAEDIIEEIGRYVGYDAIKLVMPAINSEPADLSKTHGLRKIKSLLSSGFLMRELYGYSFFDESHIRELGWNPTKCVEIKNPISENYTRLVTTLQTHLLKAVSDNSIHHKQLRFYEWGRVWHAHHDGFIEQKMLSGIFFEQENDFDFYDGKHYLQQLFEQLHIDVAWNKNEQNKFSWLSEHQTACLMHNDVCIGVAGMVDQSVVTMLSPAGGAAFIFELNGDYLLNYKRQSVKFTPLLKYPSVRRDVSIMVPLSCTAALITDVIKSVDQRIQSVALIDFFEKPEWKDQKALTFHIIMADTEKTLEHDDVEFLYSSIIDVLRSSCGAHIR